jgi:hypothetical protein
MINWKVPVGFAGFAAVVSLLAGIIGGNPFGVILLRLFLSAVVCGGLGVGVNLIVRKFLPELSANPPATQMESGEEVDIVIDEDIPLAGEAAQQQRPETVQSFEEMETVEAEEAEEAVELTDSVDEEEEQIDVMEGVEESEEEVFALEEADREQESSPDEFVPGIAAAPVADFEDLDTLPDIDRFSPTAEESVPPARPSRRNSQVEEVVRDQDPENLARAVRTFMKKDQ